MNDTVKVGAPFGAGTYNVNRSILHRLLVINVSRPEDKLTGAALSWGLRGGAGESVSPLCEPLFLFPKSDLLSETDCGKGFFWRLAVWPPSETNDPPLFFSTERKAAKQPQ